MHDATGLENPCSLIASALGARRVGLDSCHDSDSCDAPC